MKDGKIGVNFAGYHAEAGLGGLVTGDAAHGGLSASAGTPFGNKQQTVFQFTGCNSTLLITGQRAGAGIGGSADGGNESTKPLNSI